MNRAESISHHDSAPPSSLILKSVISTDIRLIDYERVDGQSFGREIIRPRWRDITLEQLEGLFDSKLAPIQEQLKKLDPIETELKAVNKRLDLVAAQVARVGDDVTEVHKQVKEQSQTLGLIQRRLERDLDRLDDHGRRIEVLEDKTSHLPTRIT